MTLLGIIKDLAIGMATGVVVSVFFYRKSLLDQLMQRVLYCDWTTEFSNHEADRDRDGLNFTMRYLNWHAEVLDNAGMKQSAKVVRALVEEIETNLSTLPTDARNPPRRNRRATTLSESEACHAEPERFNWD